MSFGHYQVAQYSRIGNRSSNHDRCLVLKRGDTVLLAVADGLGNQPSSGQAAQCLVDQLTHLFAQISIPIADPPSFLKSILVQAHKKVLELQSGESSPPRTTAVVCLIQANRARWIHCGDSRLYFIRNGCIHRRTRDHSVVETLIQHQAISEQESRSHPQRHQLTSCVGGAENRWVFGISPEICLEPNDYILLCSDGLWSPLSSVQILQNCQTPSLDRGLDTLTAMAEKNSWPHSDNVSAVGFKLLHTAAPAIAALDKPPSIPLPTKASTVDDAILEIQRAYDTYAHEIDSAAPPNSRLKK